MNDRVVNSVANSRGGTGKINTVSYNKQQLLTYTPERVGYMIALQHHVAVYLILLLE